MKLNTLKSLRLIIGATELEARGQPIPAEYVDQVAAARAEIDLMRGADVVEAVIACRGAGLSLAMDINPGLVRVTDEKSEPPAHRNRRY